VIEGDKEASKFTVSDEKIYHKVWDIFTLLLSVINVVQIPMVMSFGYFHTF
jgi:hypothetical protein